MSSKKNIINSVRTTLIVDNLSPFTGDIIECLEKLGANYVRRSVFSLAEVSAVRNGNNHHNRSDYKAKIDNLDYEIIEKDKSESDFHNGGKDYNYYNDNNDSNNNNINGIGAFNYDKVILSGRRLYSRDTNVINSRIIKHCLKDNIPVLGICYGAEILALTLGGTLRRMDNPVHKTVPITVLRSSPLVSATTTSTATLNKMHVFESHRYCVAKLPHDFEVVASSEQCKYEIFSYKDKNLFGIQFHPEKSGTDGLNLLSNFLNL
jgi:GMP synthase (glutamine-hydrolysing)